MSDIVIFAGTTEGRNVSEWLCKRKISHVVCVASEYGEQVLESDPFRTVRMGRMDQEQMTDFFKNEKVRFIVDATHPYANIVTDNIVNAAKTAGVIYKRLERGNIRDLNMGNMKIEYFESAKQCAEALLNTDGNIMLTTGSKELSVYCENETVRERLIVRVLPGKESISICEEQGIAGKHIIAMQGPFSVDMNIALIKQYDAKILVTKESGVAGGYLEKIEAANKTGVSVFVIGRPQSVQGECYEQICDALDDFVNGDQVTDNGLAIGNFGNISDDKNNNQGKVTVSLVGCGMGQIDSLTLGARRALEQAEVVFGAERLLKDMNIDKKSYPYYLAKDIMPFINGEYENIAVLFSGDTGFYSGAKKMYEVLGKCENAEILVYPGISSVSNLSAITGESWDDARIISVHGKGTPDQWGSYFIKAVRENRKCFSLLSGAADIVNIGKLLLKHGLSDVKVLAGYQMSYREQKLYELNVDECICFDVTNKGLYSVFIINENPTENIVLPGLNDEEFIRGKVPMTKEEIRTVSICKLGIYDNAVIYDIGAGTGSVTVEMARISDSVKVYAIEKKDEAIELINKNIEKFGLDNVKVVKALAPDGMEELPVPSHAFIGGSSGNLYEIVKVLLDKNPEIRVVINAVTLETISEFTSLQHEFRLSDFQIVSLAVSRNKRVGSYNMMQAENPVYICSFRGITREEYV